MPKREHYRDGWMIRFLLILRTDFTNRFGVDVGVQRYYDVRQGWRTAPMVAPSYKFRKFKLGIDVGGLFYEAVRSAIER